MADSYKSSLASYKVFASELHDQVGFLRWLDTFELDNGVQRKLVYFCVLAVDWLFDDRQRLSLQVEQLDVVSKPGLSGFWERTGKNVSRYSSGCASDAGLCCIRWDPLGSYNPKAFFT